MTNSSSSSSSSSNAYAAPQRPLCIVQWHSNASWYLSQVVLASLVNSSSSPADFSCSWLQFEGLVTERKPSYLCLRQQLKQAEQLCPANCFVPLLYLMRI
jgi:hypothetical protein